MADALDTLDPFTACEAKLWYFLERDSDITDLVSSRNRIKYNANDVNPEREVLRDADTPQISIRLSALNDQGQTSTAHRFDVAFDVRIHSGNWKSSSIFFPLLWKVIKNIRNARTSMPWSASVGPPEILGMTWVEKFDIIGVIAGIDEDENIQDKAGWMGVITVQFDCNIPDAYVES